MVLPAVGASVLLGVFFTLFRLPFGEFAGLGTLALTQRGQWIAAN